MPQKMTKLNGKTTGTFLAAKFYYTTAYSAFEDKYNEGVDLYNTQFDNAGLEEQTALDGERITLDRHKDNKEYTEGTTQLAGWPKLFPTMHTYFDERGKFANRNKTEHEDVEEDYSGKLDKIEVKNSDYSKGLGRVRKVKRDYDSEIENKTVEGLEQGLRNVRSVTKGGFVSGQFKIAKGDTTGEKDARKSFGDMVAVLKRYKETAEARKWFDKDKGELSPAVANNLLAIRPKGLPEQIESNEQYVLLAKSMDALEQFADLVPGAFDYADSLARAEAAMRLAYNPDNVNKLSTASEKKKVSAEKEFAAAKDVAEKGQLYSDAGKAMDSLAIKLGNDHKNYVGEVRKSAEKQLKGKGRAPMLKLLEGKVDGNGQDLVTALAEAFGADKIAAILEAADQVGSVDDPDKKKASANLAKLVGKLGAVGLKTLGAGLGGETAPMDGVKHAAGMMKHGLSAEQLEMLSETYETKDLTAVFQTGFGSDPELFASILGTGLGGKVENLESLTTAFGDKGQLNSLLGGLSQKEPFAKAGGEKQKAGERMKGLLASRFTTNKGVQPQKLKTPFFDTLNGLAQEHSQTVAEGRGLYQRQQAYAEFAKKTKEEKEKVDPKPVDLSQEEKQRLQKIMATVDPNLAPTPVTTLIRNAATFSIKMPSGSDKSLSGVDMNKTKCKEERVEHFLIRHSRENFPFGGDALAGEDTPLTSVDRKPATLWPEGSTASDIKSYLSDALKAYGPPPCPETFGDFTQRDVGISVGGRNVWVRLGFGKNKGSVVLTQFYPKEGSGLDTIGFEDLHGIRRALGK